MRSSVSKFSEGVVSMKQVKVTLVVFGNNWLEITAHFFGLLITLGELLAHASKADESTNEIFWKNMKELDYTSPEAHVGVEIENGAD
jgi:hypothetical protein